MATEKRQRQKEGRQIRLEAARAAQARRKRSRRLIYAALLVAVVIGLLFVLAPDDDDDVASVSSTSSTATSTSLASTTTASTLPEGASITGETPCPPADGSAERTTSFEQPPPLCIDPARTYTAVFDTSHGEIRVALDTTTTPGATNNFVTLARYHYYDETAVFRTDTSIGIVQGGSPHTQDNGDPGPGYTIEDEGFDDETAIAGQGGPFTYEPGDLVYARPGGQPDSSSAQFFFCATAACSNLDSQGIYVEFGQVTEGLEVLEAMLALDAGGAPSEAITVNAVTIEET